MIASLLSAACMGMGFLVLAKSTLTPFDNIGVMTMKMMSITSITSTIGVTLMSATGGGALNLVSLDFFAIVWSPLGTRQERGPLAAGPFFNSPEILPRPVGRPRRTPVGRGSDCYFRALAPRCDRFRK